jgi:hypothetical protein
MLADLVWIRVGSFECQFARCLAAGHSRVQSIVLRKAYLKLMPDFGSVFLHAASLQRDGRVLCEDSIPTVIPKGKDDVALSRHQVFGVGWRLRTVMPDWGEP